MWPPPPSGLSGVPFCLFPGAAGLPLTSRREDLLSRGLLDNRLSPLSSLSCGLILSWSPGLSVPLAAPRSCSITLERLRGALGTAFGAGRKEKERILPRLNSWQETWSVCTKTIKANISRNKTLKTVQKYNQTLLIYTCPDHLYMYFLYFSLKSKVIYLFNSLKQICEKLKMNTSVVALNW